MDADTRHKVEYRLELAEYDLETAKVMLEGRRYLYVGFMCHQVVEKALKACTWSLRGIEPEHTHSLTRLCRNSGIAAEMPPVHRDLLNVLEPLNIEARYPTHKQKLLRSLTHSRCTRIVNQTIGLFQWIKSLLS